MSSVPGIAAITYWSSTEGLTVTKGQEVDMFDGTASQTFKDTGFNIRCIRRITPPLHLTNGIAAPPGCQAGGGIYRPGAAPPERLFVSRRMAPAEPLNFRPRIANPIRPRDVSSPGLISPEGASPVIPRLAHSP